MKRIITTFLAAALMLSMAACGGNNKEEMETAISQIEVEDISETIKSAIETENRTIKTIEEYGEEYLIDTLGEERYKEFVAFSASELYNCTHENCDNLAVNKVSTGKVSFYIPEDTNYIVGNKGITVYDKSEKKIREDVINGNWDELEKNLDVYGSVKGESKKYNDYSLYGYYCAEHTESAKQLLDCLMWEELRNEKGNHNLISGGSCSIFSSLWWREQW